MAGDPKDKDTRKNVHGGHRARLKERYREHGLDNFNDVNVLELLLFYAVPRRDTNALAHSLLEEFGSLKNVLEADIEELRRVKGVGDSAATLLSLIPAISRRYMIEREDVGSAPQNTDTLGRYLVAQYMYQKYESLRLLCLDNRYCLIKNVELNRGAVDRVEFSLRLIVQTALKYNATQVVLAHNHVGAYPTASPQDIMGTEKIGQALRDVGIKLLDHIIVSGELYMSLAKTSTCIKL